MSAVISDIGNDVARRASALAAYSVGQYRPLKRRHRLLRYFALGKSGWRGNGWLTRGWLCGGNNGRLLAGSASIILAAIIEQSVTENLSYQARRGGVA